MVYLIFTLDYEIFGNGEGSLKELVFEPTQKLNDLFSKYGYKYVNFVEAAELIKIKEYGSDPYIQNVESQIKKMYKDGFEIALHIHPQWFNGKYIDNKWVLDYEEYNLSLLDMNKIYLYVKSCISYLRQIIGINSYSPVAFRAGGWLIQPSSNITKVLKNNNIRIETSVFNGGIQRNYKLDFTKYPKNLKYWSYSEDVLMPDIKGDIFEIPIYTEMVYFWKMYSKKRQEIYSSSKRTTLNIKQLYLSYLDKMRITYPKKFDFTKMTFLEMQDTLTRIRRR